MLALAACSTGTAPVGEKAGGGTGPPSAKADAATPSAGSAAPGSPGSTAGAGTAQPTPVQTIPDFVKASVPEEEAWGPQCFTPRPGTPCRVPFDGIAWLSTAEEGKIALIAFENDSKVPAALRLLPAVRGSNRLCFETGCPHGGAWLAYVPGPEARAVTFVVELRDPAGRALARSFPQTFPIHR